MSIKKQLGMGVVTAALGLTLVGGGTWAAFNDTATINNHFAAGTLDLTVGKVNQAANFDLGNMKPGDEVKRVFTLNNAGSLAIKEVLLNTTANGFNKGVGTNEDLTAFLSQFEIDVLSVDSENTEGKFEPRKSILQGTTPLTLADLVNNTYTGKINSAYLAQDSTDTRINLAPLVVPAGQDAKRGIPVTPADSDSVMFVIKFKEDNTRVGGASDKYGEYVQNKFQGNSASFYFNLEATQWDGMSLDSSNVNGEINNGVQGSSDNGNEPKPASIKTKNGTDLRKHGDNEVVEPANQN
ncbi:TasA family protein [Fictibacillus nanhaiensis]|uniref:TasA family protein n=1 Tax=Fictibacillus nanhaiensis TaxID=742169 RepID=UPI003C2848CC